MKNRARESAHVKFSNHVVNPKNVVTYAVYGILDIDERWFYFLLSRASAWRNHPEKTGIAQPKPDTEKFQEKILRT